MPIPLTGPSGVFPRVGAVGGLLAAVNAARGSAVPAQVAALAAAYPAGSPPLEGLNPAVASWSAGQDALLSRLRDLAAAAVIDAAQADSPLPDPTIGAALARVVARMVATGDTVSRRVPAVSLAAAAGNTGDPAWVVGSTLDSGRLAETQFAESWAFACTRDAQGGGAAAGSEPIAGRGLPAAPSTLDPAWPAGSGASASLRAIDPALAPGLGGQLLANGDFESWTVSNVPDGWTIRTGTAGTHTLRSSSPYAGTYALALPSDGTTATALDQTFGANGVPALLPLTQYAWSCRAKASASTTGSLEVALVDGSGSVLLDGQGAPAAAAIDLATLSTSYTPIGGMLRTPRVLPATARFRVRLATPPPSGVSVTLDRMALARPARLYPGGPRVACFAGATPMVAGDAWTLAASAGAGGGFALLFERLFGMRDLGLLLPSSASPTISDSLIA